MRKVILKAALVTLGALAALGILVFSLWILISPQSMATLSEKLGNYSFAVTCAELKYKYSDKTGDLARCAEDSILSGEDKLIVKYCEQLIGEDDFEELCRQKDDMLKASQFSRWTTDYRSYILGNLAVSQYRRGDLKKAVATCEQGKEFDCFKRLIYAVVASGSAEDLQTLKTAPENLGAQEYITSLLAIHNL